MTKLELVKDAAARNEEIIYKAGPEVYGVLWPGFSQYATEALNRALQEMENEVYKATDSLVRFGEDIEDWAEFAEEQYRTVATNRQWYLYNVY